MTSYAWIGAGLGAFIATRVSEDATGRAALRARLLQTVPALEPVYSLVPECALDIMEVMGCALLGSIGITLVFTALSGVLPAVAVAAAYACIRSGHAERLREMTRELLQGRRASAELVAPAPALLGGLASTHVRTTSTSADR